VINATTAQLGPYPQAQEAVKAIAAAHHLEIEQVLPTAGGAEAFTLIARGLAARRPVVVHPQFTEPEAALLAAGHPVGRVILFAADGFRLDAHRVPADADLVIIGNPTNPTSVLHPAAVIRALLRPGRAVVVDEAFMDAVPGESESVIGGPMAGLIVVRSLTKTWGLAGLRAGYVVGDATLIEALRAQQPPWSVSTPALAATVACLSEQARTIAAQTLPQLAADRERLVALLTDVGVPPVPAPQAPFLLVDTSPLRGGRHPGWVRQRLRQLGFAVRRGESFPGLGHDWIRIAVRDAETSRRLAQALFTLVERPLS
jgi:cobyrinic acid a,c-diamide synthase